MAIAQLLTGSNPADQAEASMQEHSNEKNKETDI
jgi:hypothetical protein